MTETKEIQQADKLRKAKENIFNQLGRIIVGQTDTAEQILITLFAGGHALLVGVPGLAKTLMVSTLAEILYWHFRPANSGFVFLSNFPSVHQGQTSEDEYRHSLAKMDHPY